MADWGRMEDMMIDTLRPALLAGAIALGHASAAGAQEVTLRVQHFLPTAASIPRYFIEPWAELVEAESEGRIKVEVYPAMQLGGKPPALYDQIRDGVIDVGWTVASYTPGRFPETEVFELPFMTTMRAEESSRAAWDYAQEHLTERFSDIHLCAAHVHGPGVIHTKGDPLETVEDFAGLKLRGPSRPVSELLETLGAEPVSMPVPAFPEALSQGVVDGGVIPWEVVPSLKVQELTDSHTQISGDRGLYNIFFIFGVNKDTYEGLSAQNRGVIDANCGVEASARAGAAMDLGDSVARVELNARGNAIVTLSEDVVGELRVIGDAQREAWIEEATSKGLDGQALVDDAEALVAKYAGRS